MVDYYSVGNELILMDKKLLLRLYREQKLSMQQVASMQGCSLHKVAYWMDAYNIQRRSIGEAVYQRHNPGGDPFFVKQNLSKDETKLLGLGLGIYWGEGNKANKHAVRVGNTDPKLIKTFIRFLTELFSVDPAKLRFGLQLFSDINPDKALAYWVDQLSVSQDQFYKVTVTPSGSVGTYRKKSKYGVLTVHFNNKKLRDIIVQMLPR